MKVHCYLKKMAGKDDSADAKTGNDSGTGKQARSEAKVHESTVGNVQAGSKEERQLQKQREAEQRRRERENDRLMALIASSEERICELEVEMMNPEIGTDHEALAKLAQEMAELKEIVENAYDEWDNLV